jgi:hypothetical protein
VITKTPAGRTLNLILADPRRPTPGPCSICGAPATTWQRSGRRSTDADGLTLSVRYCDQDEQDALAALGALEIADVAALVPPSRRAARAAGARARAARQLGLNRAHGRTSAELMGASSATHTHALLGGYARMQAEALLALADALDTIRHNEVRS